jgi:hypothetical protein
VGIDDFSPVDSGIIVDATVQRGGKLLPALAKYCNTACPTSSLLGAFPTLRLA